MAADSEDPVVQAAAAQYYVLHYGVSEPEAYRRLQIQDDAQAVLDGVRQDVGSEWAGSWFDPEDGGRLKIAIAGGGSPPSGSGIDQARSLLASKGVDGYADFVSVRSSLTTLESATSVVDQQLTTLLSEGKVATGVDPRANSVAIREAKGITDPQSTEVQSVTAPVSVVVQQSNMTDLRTTAQACSLSPGEVSSSELYCDPPLRGGMLISASSGEVCSGGYYVESTSDFQPYLLTAGHCMYATPGNVWSSRFSDGSPHAIGTTWPHYVDDLGGDYGMISIDNPDGWGLSDTSTMVWVGASAGGTTSQDSLYPIYQAGSSSVGLVVCMTSGVLITQTGYHTDCGEVTQLNTTEYEDNQPVTEHLALTNLCGVSGASGSPVYKDHTGYGLIIAGHSTACDEQYQGLGAAEAQLHVSVVP